MNGKAGSGYAYCSRFESRMLFSNSDKIKILKYIAPGNIADLGTGTGSVIRLLKEIPNLDIIGFDCNDDYLGTARRLHPETRFYNADLLNEERFHPFHNYFDTVILSSVLHEIDWPHGLSAFRQVVNLAYSLLKKHGILIFRDGVKPENGAKRLHVRFLTQYGKRKFYCFIKEYRQRAIAFQKITPNNNSVSISSYDLHDFLCKYYFEGDLWHGDMDQVFGIRNSSEYKEIFGSKFKLLHTETYIAAYLKQLWDKDFKLSGGKFPDSHILLVARKI